MSDISSAARDNLYKHYLLLIKSAISGLAPPEPPAGFNFAQLYALSAQNHTSHMLHEPISRLSDKPDRETRALFLCEFAKSVARDTEQTAAFAEIVSRLTASGIDLLPIKGIELKKLYPASYLRRMTDLDIVYDAHGNEEEARRHMEALGYSRESWGGGHHDIFHRAPVMNVELHRSADYPEYFGVPGGPVPDVSVSGLYHLSPADTYVMLLRHNARHMSRGGLGVRAVCDIYLLMSQYRAELESDYTRRRLEEFGIVRFAQKLGQIADDWFGEGQPIINEAGRIILSGRTYGSPSDSEMLRLASSEKGSKFSYALSRLLPGYAIMKKQHKILSSLPFLLPFFWIKRGLLILSSPKRRKNIRIMRAVLSSNDENMARYEFMMREFGLDLIS